MLYGDTSLINNEIDIYRSISREEIQDVANKYLNPNQRLILEYLPESKEN
jgi:predicted Zn-dependent peptidase